MTPHIIAALCLLSSSFLAPAAPAIAQHRQQQQHTIRRMITRKMIRMMTKMVVPLSISNMWIPSVSLSINSHLFMLLRKDDESVSGTFIDELSVF